MYVQEMLLQLLHPQMPLTIPPNFNSRGGAEYAQSVRQALTATFHILNEQFTARGEVSGCTLTVAVVTGKLLTVANLGALLLSCDWPGLRTEY